MPPLLPLSQLAPILRRQAVPLIPSSTSTISSPRAQLSIYTCLAKRGYAIDYYGQRPGGPYDPRQQQNQQQQPVGGGNEGPNLDTLPGVNEETVGINEAMGGEGEGLDMENVKWVNEVIQHEQEFYDNNTPEVMKQEQEGSSYPGSEQGGYGGYDQYQGYPPLPADQFRNPNQYDSQFYQPLPGSGGEYPSQPPSPPSSSSSSSTRTPALPPQQSYSTAFSSQILTETLNYPKVFHPTVTPYTLDPNNPVSKYPLPALPLPSTSHLHHRFSPLLDLIVNLFIVDGKKATAQKNVQKILDILRTKAPPKEQSKFTLIANHPPLATLPRNPLAYLKTAIDSVAPLMRLKTMKGSGGFSNQVPEPLNERQRRRTAVKWMLAAANNKRDRLRFAERFADEVVAVVEGRSSAWDRRLMVHKTAVGARANVKVKL